MVLKLRKKAIITMLAERGMSLQNVVDNAGVRGSNGINQALQRGSCGPKMAGIFAKGLGVPLDEIVELEGD